MPAVFTVPAVFKAVDKISATTRRMQKSVKKFGISAIMEDQNYLQLASSIIDARDR